MSAFVVDKDHIDYLVTALIVYHAMPQDMIADSVGRMLWDENAESVAYRYSEDPFDTSGYRWRTVPRGSITPAQVLKAAKCWQYQTCEHPTHPNGTGWQLVERLMSAAVSELPDYNGALWEWTRRASAAAAAPRALKLVTGKH